MSDKDKHMTMYSSSDIEKYLSGEMSDPEMYALERAALDDPFLADALEGMSVHQNLPGEPVFRTDMAHLEKRLEERVSSGNKSDDGVTPGKAGRVRLLPLAVRYAAAIVLLVGLGATAYITLFNRKPKGSTLSRNEVRVPTPDRAAAQSDTGTLAASQAQVPAIKPAGFDSDRVVLRDGVTEPSAKKIADKEINTKDVRENRLLYKNDLTALAKQPPASAYSNTSPNANTYDVYKYSQRPIFGDSIASHRDSFAYNLNGRVAGLQTEEYKSSLFDKLVVRGKVINPQNTPLAGATVTIRGIQSLSATTDKDGNFTFQLPKKDSVPGVVVNYVGYEQEFSTLNTDDKTGNIIKLKPQSLSLNEVVVVGYGSKRRELTKANINSEPQPLSQVAVPAEGWPDYTNYLELNKRSGEVDSTIRGYESISFIVNKKGELSSFKVEQSLSPAHDSLVIRLIKQGPSWKSLSGKKERARVVLTW